MNQNNLVSNPNLKAEDIKDEKVSKKNKFLSSLKFITNNKNAGIKIVLLLIASLFLYMASRFVFGQSTITVVGIGEYEFKPDKVSFAVTYSNVNPSPTLAIQNGETGTNNLIQIVRNSYPNAQVQRAFYQVQPTSDIGGSKVYQVTNAFGVESNSIENINPTIQLLYESGATSVTGLSFGSQNENEMTRKARALAIKDAKKEARNIAASAGKFLGKIVTINDDQQALSSDIGYSEEGTNFTDMSITKNVSIVYKIW